MRTSSEAAGRPERGLFGVVPPGRATDVAVAALVAVVQLGLTTLAARHRPGFQDLDLLAYLLLAAGPVALLWRRRFPAGVLAVVMAACVVYFALGYPYGPAWVALIVALWTAVTGGARRAAWVTAFVGLAAYFTLAALVGRVQPATRPRSPPTPARCCWAWPWPRWPWPAASAAWTPSGPGPRRPGGGPARSACASPASCTTCSPTTSR